MFDPLGRFNPKAPISSQLIAKAWAFEASLPTLPSGAYFERGALHWTVAPMGCEFKDYDAMADVLDGNWHIGLTGNVIGNATGNAATEASHTYLENSHSFGIALAGMDGATEANFGPDPVTIAGLETLCAMAAAVSRKYGIDVSARLPNGRPTWATHAEYAVWDAYPNERWDLGSLTPLPRGIALTPEMRTTCGDALRERIRSIKLALP